MLSKADCTKRSDSLSRALGGEKEEGLGFRMDSLYRALGGGRRLFLALGLTHVEGAEGGACTRGVAGGKGNKCTVCMQQPHSPMLGCPKQPPPSRCLMDEGVPTPREGGYA